jgi:serine O-acetyltransferase
VAAAKEAHMRQIQISSSPAPVALCEVERPESLLEDVWAAMQSEAIEAGERDPALAKPLAASLLRQSGFAEALADRLARKLADADFPAPALVSLFTEALAFDPGIERAAAADLTAVRDRDPACPDLITPFLYFKGYNALQAYRFSHSLWREGRRHLAHHVQSRASEVFAVDIHPASRLGCGILVDHGTGLVIGETAVVEDDVSILQGVTLGGTGKECGDRHPKVRRGVLIGAGAKILGNIEIGEGAKIGAASVVLDPVPPHTTVVGVPARPVGAPLTGLPALTMDHRIPPPEYAI